MAKFSHDVQKKQHRERSQVAERARFGFLEKHKDYIKRAQNFHRKQNTLKVLRSKVSERNTDEYYHAMNSKTVDKDGIYVASRNSTGSAFSTDQIKLLKTQDSNYVRTLRQTSARKAEKLANCLTFKHKGKHTIFVESYDDMTTFTPELHFKTSSDILYKTENRLTNEQLAIASLKGSDSLMPRDSLLKKRAKKLKQISSHLKREHKLAEVQHYMDQQRELMKKGSKKKLVDSDGKVMYKWKKQRKR